MPAVGSYPQIALEKYKEPRKRIYIEKAETGRLEKIIKKDTRDDGDLVKAYKFAYDKNNFEFSPPQAKRVSVAEEYANRRLKLPCIGMYNVERGLQAASKSPTARKR